MIGLALALVGAAIVAHLLLRARSNADTYTGPLLVLDHLFDLAAALALVAVCLSAGGALLDRVGIALETPLERQLVSLALGTASLATLYLALGALGLMWRPLVIGLPVAVAALTARRLRALPADVGRTVAFVRERGGHPLFAVTALAVLGLVGAVLVVQAVPPPTDWDSLMYHLQVPRQFLDEGRIHTPADNLHVAFVGLAQMLFLPLLAAGSGSGPAILNACFAVGLGFAVFSLAERFLAGEVASVATVGLWGSTSLLLVALTPRIDVTLALYLTLATHFALAALARPNWRRQLGLSALLLGLALGIKLQAGAFILAMGPLLLWAAVSRAESPGAGVRAVSTMAVLGVAGAAPWLVKNWLLVGDPFYPLLDAYRLTPWLAELYGSVTAPVDVGREVYHILDQARQPVDPVSLFLAPGRLTVEAEGAHYRLSWLLPLLVFFPLFWRKRELSWLVAIGALYLALVILPRDTTNLRYLIPALPLLTMAASYMGLELLRGALRADWMRPAAIVLVLATLIPSADVMRYWLSKSAVLGYVAGSTSPREYLRGGFAYYADMVEGVNERVPADATVLLLFEARGLYFEPRVIQDNVLTNWPLLAHWVRERGSCLGSTDASHVLAASAAVNYYVSRGADPALFRGGAFQDFALRCLEPLYRGRGFLLFRLKSEE